MKPQALGETILRSITDEKLFAQHFQPAESWTAWLTVLRALFGLELSPDVLPLFQKATGRTQPFSEPLTEAWLLCGPPVWQEPEPHPGAYRGPSGLLSRLQAIPGAG